MACLTATSMCVSFSWKIQTNATRRSPLIIIITALHLSKLNYKIQVATVLIVVEDIEPKEDKVL